MQREQKKAGPWSKNAARGVFFKKSQVDQQYMAIILSW